MKQIAARALLAFVVTLQSCAGQPKIVSQGAPPPAHVFTLADQNGKRVTIGNNGGTPTALYFGFAHCKDICPQTLQRLVHARAQAHLLPSQLRVAMVTVDPAHDTPVALAAFLRKTRVDAIALTGSLRQLHPVYRSYGVVIEPQKGGDLGHTDYVYLIDRQGELVNALPPQTALSKVATELRRLVQ